MIFFWGGGVRPSHVIMTNTIKTLYWLGDASRIMIYLSTLKLDIWLLNFFFLVLGPATSVYILSKLHEGILLITGWL